MDALASFVNSVNNVLWSYVLIALLIGIGVWFTVRTDFVQIRYLGEMIRLLKEGVGEKTTGKEISPFQAFCISTASRVGVGNIAGIGIAVVTGGPGAIFWMWVIALIGSATGFIESTLAQIYKVPLEHGGFHGGPAYYIKNALKQPWVANLFAVLITITFALIYNSVQSNTIALSLQAAYGISTYGTGLVLAALTAIIIFGGATRIAKVTEYLVPFMAGIYILIAVAITIMNLDKVPGMFAQIFGSAFSPDAAVGGGVGTVIMTGIKRGLFSNEAGEGSVPNAAATANASHPVKQGLIQGFGVFVDTLLVCSATACVILLSNSYTIGGELTGIALAQAAMSYHLGAWAAYFISFMICLFAFSSIIGNYYYGEINISYLTRNKMAMNIFRLFVIGMVFFGSTAKLSLVWDLADLFMAFLALTNLYAIARLAKYAYIALDDYSSQKKQGVEEPTFLATSLPDQVGVECWDKAEKD